MLVGGGEDALVSRKKQKNRRDERQTCRSFPQVPSMIGRRLSKGLLRAVIMLMPMRLYGAAGMGNRFE